MAHVVEWWRLTSRRLIALSILLLLCLLYWNRLLVWAAQRVAERWRWLHHRRYRWAFWLCIHFLFCIFLWLLWSFRRRFTVDRRLFRSSSLLLRTVQFVIRYFTVKLFGLFAIDAFAAIVLLLRTSAFLSFDVWLILIEILVGIQRLIELRRGWGQLIILWIGEDVIALDILWNQSIQVILKLLQCCIEWHFVGCTRQLSATSWWRRHHPDVLKWIRWEYDKFSY